MMMMLMRRRRRRRRIEVFCVVVQNTVLFISQIVLPLFPRIRECRYSA
jgi:hypothetical protein